MKCNKVKSKFILFLDNELKENTKEQIQSHLNCCPGCAKKLKALADVYLPVAEIEKFDAKSYLWEKIYLKICEGEYKSTRKFGFLQNIPRFASIFLLAVIFSVSVMFGVYLGNYSSFQDNQTLTNNSEISDQERFVQENYIDSFDDMPNESIASFYLVLEIE